MKCYLYDLEIFRNYISAVFIDYDDFYEVRKKIDDENIPRHKAIKLLESIPHKIFELSSVEGYQVNDLSKLLTFAFSGNYLAGFNSLGYDDLILNFIAMNFSRYSSLEKFIYVVYEFSKRIIETPHEVLYNMEDIKYIKRYNSNYHSIDVQKIPALDKVRKSLKQTLINLKFYNILDYEMPPISDIDKHLYDPRFISSIADWDRYMMKEYIPELKVYNVNDVLGVGELFYHLHDDIALRFQISSQYGINVLSASRSKIGDVFFSKYYLEKTGISHSEFYKNKTYRKRINLAECVSPMVSFKTKEFNDVLDKIKGTIVYTTKDLNISFKYDGNEYSIMSGGLHTVDKPDKFFENESNEIIDADVSSYYPMLILNNKVIPKHLDESFLVVYEELVEDRLKAKADGDTVRADTLKITVNGVYGKFAFEFGPLFDIKCTLTVTISGQLELLMLVERLSLIGIKTISANTDGITCIVPKDKKEDYLKVCKKWEEDVNLQLEFTNYTTYVRRSVNHYFAIKKYDGEFNPKKHIKQKGDLHSRLAIEDLQKGFNKPIVPIAIQNYYINNIPIMETITNHKDIYDFCMTSNIDRKFNLEYTYVEKGKVYKEYPQRNTRFYASTKGGSLVKDSKIDPSAKRSNMCAGYKVQTFNRYFHKDNMEDYNIDYKYYIRECNKIINQIETGVRNEAGAKKKIRNKLDQLSLFD